MPDRSLYRSLAAVVIITTTTLMLWAVGCKMKRVHVDTAPKQPVALLVGGKEPLTVSRVQEGTGGSPEFLSLTLLPGRGMNLYQISAYLPGQGVTNLLVSPPIEQEAPLLTDKGNDANGYLTSQMGGAFLLPYSSPIHGAERDGKAEPGSDAKDDGQMISTGWDGHLIKVPADTADLLQGMMPFATGGLILDKAIEGQVDDQLLLDGHDLTATIHAGNYDGHWPSTTDVKFKILLSPRAIDLAVTVQNTGSEAEPVSVGWKPYFAIPSGQRGQVRLHIPAGQRIETSDAKNMTPTGRLLPVAGTPYDFSLHSGMPLNNLSLDHDYIALKSTVFDMGPTIELMDPAASYGLRMVCRSTEIKDIHVYAPADKNFVSIEPQFGYLDPLNKVWKSSDNGMVVLQPGESVKWAVRLEFYTPVDHESKPAFP